MVTLVAQLAAGHDVGAGVDGRAGADFDVRADRGAGMHVDVVAQPRGGVDQSGAADADAAARAGRPEVRDDGREGPMHVVDHDGRHGQGFARKAARHHRGLRAGGGQMAGLFVLVDQRDVARPGVVQGGGAVHFDRGVADHLTIDQSRQNGQARRHRRNPFRTRGMALQVPNPSGDGNVTPCPRRGNSEVTAC